MLALISFTLVMPHFEVLLIHSHTHTHTHTSRMWWVNCHLNYTKMKITLSDIFNKITWKYLEILFVKFTQRNCHWLQPRWLSNGLLVWVSKCCHYLCLQFIFVVAWSFIGLLLNHATHIVIKEIAIWGVWQTDIWSDVVAEIFCQLSLSFPVWVPWHRFQSPDIKSPSSHSLDS